jgi:hypothetical protein
MSENRQNTAHRRLSFSCMTMTTSPTTQSATFHIEALSPERLEAIRRSGTDDGGNHVFPTRTAQGGEPVRCCLHIAGPGERLLLIAYRPFNKPSPYAETGPVFVHAERCGGYSWPDRYPDEFRGRQQVFRCYDADGNILGGHVAEPTEEAEAVITDLFANEDVEYIHTRNVVFGCYMLEIRRQPA